MPHRSTPARCNKSPHESQTAPCANDLYLKPDRAMRRSSSIILAAMVAISLSTGLVVLLRAHDVRSDTDPDLVDLPPGIFSYRSSGEFTRDGFPISAPVKRVTLVGRLLIMKHQVTSAEYRRCVQARACPMLDLNEAADDLPAVKMNWLDATAYAKWLSGVSGVTYRLPTDEEWAYAAASRFADDAAAAVDGKVDPGHRVLAEYTRSSDRENAFEKKPRPIGSFGVNENGLLDVAGNVWEWTDTCYSRNSLNVGSEVGSSTTYCGVRVIEGAHRMYLTDFLRDPKLGGCTTAVPPSNLGLRLVRGERV